MNYSVKGNDLTSVADAIRTKGGTSASLSFPDGFIDAIDDIPTGGGSTLITKNITANGTYDASSDNADGYSSVTVNVVEDVISGTFSSDSTTSQTINFGKTFSNYFVYFEMTEASKNDLCTAISGSGNNRMFGFFQIKWGGCNSFSQTNMTFLQRTNGTNSTNNYQSGAVVTMNSDNIVVTPHALGDGANYIFVGYTYNYRIVATS